MYSKSHYTWNKTSRKAGKNEIASALEELINANTPLYQRETELLCQMQINLLKAILKGEKKITSAAIMQNYFLGTPRNVSKNKESLLRNEIIIEVNGEYEMIDSAFEF